MEPDRIALWLFPREDFAAWSAMVGSPQVADYDAYLMLLAAVQADQERQGRTVVRVRLTVSQMRERLAAADWSNTPDHRAAIAALAAAERIGE